MAAQLLLRVITFLVLVPVTLTYFFITPEGPHRPLLNGITLGVLVAILALLALPARRIASARWSLPFLHGWSIASVLLSGLMIWLDGGTQSPALLYFFMVYLFTSQTYSTPAVLAYTLFIGTVFSCIAWLQDVEPGFTGQNVLRLGALMLAGCYAASVAYARERNGQDSRGLRQQLADLASRDLMTNSLNHAAFNERLEEELTRMARESSGLALFLIDLDYFKNINDEHGHLIGDKALCAVVEVIRNCARKSEVLGRFGGDEFALFTSGAHAGQPEVLAERIQRQVAGMDLGFPITLSMGIVKVDCGARVWNQHEVLTLADQALYQAKQAGRNNFVMVSAPALP